MDPLAAASSFPGSFHVDFVGNAAPQLEGGGLGFYPEAPRRAGDETESCGAHRPRVEPQRLATRGVER